MRIKWSACSQQYEVTNVSRWDIVNKDEIELNSNWNCPWSFSLVVCSNDIATKGLCSLARAMKMNSSLRRIYIWGNKLLEPVCNVSTFLWHILGRGHQRKQRNYLNRIAMLEIKVIFFPSTDIILAFQGISRAYVRPCTSPGCRRHWRNFLCRGRYYIFKPSEQLLLINCKGNF